MSYLRASLGANEQIVVRAKHHWIMPLMATVRFLFWSAAWFAIMLFAQQISAWGTRITKARVDGDTAQMLVYIVGGVGAFLFLLNILRYFMFWVFLMSTEYAATDRRVVMKSGLIRRRAFDVRLAQIETVSISQSMRGRLLGYGRVRITATGGSSGSWPTIARPLDFKRAIEQSIDRLSEQQGRAQHGPHVAPAAAEAPRVSATGAYLVRGVNADGDDVELTIQAQTPENAKIKAEMKDVRVGSVEPA